MTAEKKGNAGKARKVPIFGLLLALSLVLGYIDRATPLTWLLGGAIPGIKLGLANTVLLYAVFLMDWKGSVLLMLAKVLLSGFMFGSLSAILYSLSGGVLSLLVMQLVKKAPRLGAVIIAGLCIVSDIVLWHLHPHPRGQILWCMILIGLAGAAGIALFFVIRLRPDYKVMGVSVSGAAAHNIGQVIAAALIVQTPQLLYSYMPFLVGIGAVVGCLTGFVAMMVFHALKSPGFYTS